MTVSDCKFGPSPGSPAIPAMPPAPAIPATPKTTGNIATNGCSGAIDYVGASTLTITDTEFVSNVTNDDYGGAIYDAGTGGLTVGGNSVFTSNQANGIDAFGGAIATVPISANPPSIVIDRASSSTTASRAL